MAHVQPHQVNSKIENFIYKSLSRSRRGDVYAERKATKLPVLWQPQQPEKELQEDKDHGSPANKALQGLQTEVHAEASGADSAKRRMNIIALAFDMARAVEDFIIKAKKFYYGVMLFGYRCPECSGPLAMSAEGKAKCTSCGLDIDPTVQFQRCLACGGVPVLKVRKYQCRQCGSDIRSNFLFDGLVFDADYFQQKMVQSRQRRKELRERVRRMLVETRSASLPLAGIDLDSVPSLVEALNSLTAGFDRDLVVEAKTAFDLRCYERHIQAHIRDVASNLRDIPPLSKDGRRDLVWRFIAIIFLTHAGVVDIWQEGQEIMVMKHETNRKGQDISGELEESDGIEGPVGGIEAG